MTTTEPHLTLDQTLNELEEVSGTLHALESRRTELVSMARVLGANWERVGEAMGVTKQAAWERFSDKVGG